MIQFILASQSPRRKKLLKQMGLSFAMMPALGKEYADDSCKEDYVVHLAEHKAREVLERIEQDPNSPRGIELKPGDPFCVIGADTVVVCCGTILGKPKDRTDAVRMIRLLQGRTHEVMTGVSLFWKSWGTKKEADGDSFHCTTRVHVVPMEEKEILDYIETGEADDKAGAYGIQGAFGIYVSGIEGDYYNVVGLPISELYQHMKKDGLLKLT